MLYIEQSLFIYTLSLLSLSLSLSLVSLFAAPVSALGSRKLLVYQIPLNRKRLPTLCVKIVVFVHLYRIYYRYYIIIIIS